MKYRDEDIVLTKSDNIYKFKDLVPSTKNYMYLKVLPNTKIMIAKGNYIKTMFKLKNIEKKNLSDIKCQFFYDYLYMLLDQVNKENSAYQFNFQYKEDITLYSCSIYPCMIYQECKSFDVVVRKNVERDSSRQYFTEL